MMAEFNIATVVASYGRASFFGKPAVPPEGFMNADGTPSAAGKKFADFCELTKLSPLAELGNFYLRSPGLFELSFKGLLKMLYNSKAFSTIHSDVVLTGDAFSSGMRDGNPFIDHVRTGMSAGFTRRGKSGEDIPGFAFDNIDGCYAIAIKTDSHRLTSVVNRSELLASMPRSISPESVWYKFPGEMAKKTALKRLAKTALLMTDAGDTIAAIDTDNQLTA